MEIEIKGFNKINVKYILLDVNGTLSTDGCLIDGVKEKIEKLNKNFEIFLLTADTFGKGQEIASVLGVNFKKIGGTNEAEEKLKFLKHLGEKNCIAIGNGNNDILMLKEAALGIGIVGEEGISRDALINSHIIFKNINDALSSILNPKRILATLRR